MAWVAVAAGLVILLLAGDALVKGAVNLSLRLGVPALVVSLTVVAFGTSAPELLVSIQAILRGAPDIALGNVVGSNTANVLLVLGVPALFAGLHTSGSDTRDSYLQMIAGTLLFIGLCAFGTIGWTSGLVLLAALAAMLVHAGTVARRHRHGRAAAQAAGEAADEAIEGADPDLPGWRIAVYLLAGLVGLPLGADLLVDGATVIARTFGMSEAAIGLTLVALGTSLPELATTTVAALRRQADVAMGNVIGSNMFNLLGIVGIASIVGTIPVAPEFLRFDLWVMLGASLLLVPFVFLGRDITWPWGLVLSTLYLLYATLVLS